MWVAVIAISNMIACEYMGWYRIRIRAMCCSIARFYKIKRMWLSVEPKWEKLRDLNSSTMAIGWKSSCSRYLFQGQLLIYKLLMEWSLCIVIFQIWRLNLKYFCAGHVVSWKLPGNNVTGVILCFSHHSSNQIFLLFLVRALTFSRTELLAYRTEPFRKKSSFRQKIFDLSSVS